MYPQFVQEAHRQLKLSHTNAKEYLQAQHVRQQHAHNNRGISEEFCVGDRVWLYTPVVPKVHTKKFASFWKGPYTILDKPGLVNYKIQLIGEHNNLWCIAVGLKLCYTLFLQQPPPLTVSTQSMPEPQHCPTLYSDVAAGRSLGIAGYTSATSSTTSATPVQSSTRPPRVHRPPSLYDDFVRLNLVRTQDLAGK